MNTAMNPTFGRRMQGFSVVTILVTIVIILGIAAAAWFLIVRPHHEAVLAEQQSVQAGPHVASKAPPPVAVAAMSTSQLLTEASKAIKEQRWLAPQGNNAFEFYLKVLDREPGNEVAKDALRETFPFAANAAEQVINQGNFDEAEREIALLAKADPDNYTLTILRSKLDARRRVVAQLQQAQQLAAQQQQQAAVAAAAEAKAKADQLAQQQAAQRAAQQTEAKRAAAQQRVERVARQPAAAPAQPEVVIQGAVAVKEVAADYPPEANRAGQQGWVVVQFTVGTDGQVRDAHVVDSHPAHIFDRAAVRAISRWVFKPALRDGKPMAVTMTKRFNFSLGTNG